MQSLFFIGRWIAQNSSICTGISYDIFPLLFLIRYGKI